MSVTPVVRAESLLVVRGGLPILRDVSFDVAAGEFVALMGGNGSGKTTLVRTLLGLLPYQGGGVELFGTELAAFRDWKRVGYVPQRGHVGIKQATVAEVVATGRLSVRPLFRPPSAADRLQTAEALEAVGLGGRTHSPFTELSGGQQQRVLIARALVGDAQLLVLDEPFAGVDLSVQASLADLLGELNRAGRTLLVVLHETGPLAPLLTRGIVLKEGRIAHIGPPPQASEQHHPSPSRRRDPLLSGWEH